MTEEDENCELLEQNERRERLFQIRKKEVTGFKPFIIYSLSKKPDHLLWYIAHHASARMVKEEIAEGLNMNIKDMVIMWGGQIIEDNDTVVNISTVSPKNPYDCPTFAVYELRLVELAKRNDKKGMQSYFQEIHLSDKFLNPCRQTFGERYKVGYSHLDVAATCANSAIVQALLDYSEDWIRHPIFLWPTIYFAAATNNVGAMKVLLDNGADVDALPDYQRSASVLHLSCRDGHFELVKLLISAGARSCATSVFRDGWYPIHFAVEGAVEKFSNKRRDIVASLLDSGYSAHDRTNDGRTALHLTVSESAPLYSDDSVDAYQERSHTFNLRIMEMAGLLLERGTSPDAFDNNGSTALHLAVITKRPNPDRFESVEEYNSIIEVQNLCVLEKVKFLTAHGCDFLLLNKMDETAYDLCDPLNKPTADFLDDAMTKVKLQNGFKRQRITFLFTKGDIVEL